MLEYVLFVLGVALAMTRVAAIIRRPRHPLLGTACLVVATIVLMFGAWSASEIGDKDDGPSNVEPTTAPSQS